MIASLITLFALIRDTKKTTKEIKKQQKKELYQLLLYAYDHSYYYRRVFREKGIN